jgi:hypothetical protein
VDVYSFRANRVNKLRAFEALVDNYCKGVQTDIEVVRRKTDEEFHFWLEAKVIAAKKEAQIKKQQQAKRGN